MQLSLLHAEVKVQHKMLCQEQLPLGLDGTRTALALCPSATPPGLCLGITKWQCWACLGPKRANPFHTQHSYGECGPAPWRRGPAGHGPQICLCANSPPTALLSSDNHHVADLRPSMKKKQPPCSKMVFPLISDTADLRPSIKKKPTTVKNGVLADLTHS